LQIQVKGHLSLLPLLLQPDGLLGVRVGVDHGHGSLDGKRGGGIGGGCLDGKGSGQHLTDGQHQQDDSHAQSLDGDHGQGRQQGGDHAHDKGAWHQGEADAPQEMMAKGTAFWKKVWTN